MSRLSLLTALVLTAACLSSAWGWTLRPALRAARLGAASAAVAGLLGASPAVFAELDVDAVAPIASGVRVISVTTSDGPRPAASKVQGGDDDSDDDLSYKSSVSREKKKQDEIKKKSKAQRGKDLCEQLGRGC